MTAEEAKTPEEIAKYNKQFSSTFWLGEDCWSNQESAQVTGSKEIKDKEGRITRIDITCSGGKILSIRNLINAKWDCKERKCITPTGTAQKLAREVYVALREKLNETLPTDQQLIDAFLAHVNGKTIACERGTMQYMRRGYNGAKDNLADIVNFNIVDENGQVVEVPLDQDLVKIN